MVGASNPQICAWYLISITHIRLISWTEIKIELPFFSRICFKHHFPPPFADCFVLQISPQEIFSPPQKNLYMLRLSEPPSPCTFQVNNLRWLRALEWRYEDLVWLQIRVRRFLCLPVLKYRLNTRFQDDRKTSVKAWHRFLGSIEFQEMKVWDSHVDIIWRSAHQNI